MTLKDISAGRTARIISVEGEGSLRQHLLDMGLIPGVEVTVLKYAPMGDPVEVLVRGYTLTLRLNEAGMVGVEPVEASAAAPDEDPDFGYDISLHELNAHPGLGETGKYHSRNHENPLPKGTVLELVIVGQQNCGKTALYNALTGSNNRVGNFPGVTVERSEAVIPGRPDTRVSDLPGLYSLSTTTPEELLTRNYLLNERPHCIINVVDAGNIERNLYLTVQLMELGIPMVLALNMMDEVRKNGGSVRVNEMERVLGIPVVPVSAARNEGLDELVDHAVHVAVYQEPPARHDFCDPCDFGGAVHRCLHSIMHLVEDHCQRIGLPKRFAASRIVAGDRSVIDSLGIGAEEIATLESIISVMEKERGLDRDAAMAEMRYTFIHRLCSRTVVKPDESREYRRSISIDRVFTGKWTAVPIFVVIMSLVLWLSIDVIGASLQSLLARGVTWLGSLTGSGLDALKVSPAVKSLVVDAIFGGVGSVVSFVPVILTLFFFLSLLEDSGYMARVAFLADRLLRKLGLSGRSVVPMLIGFGCSVPAVMAARTLPSARDRKKTILLIPFMSCSARIPVYVFLTSTFFPGHGGLIMMGLYLLAVTIGILVALVSKLLPGNSNAAPFMMELPNYRIPQLKNLVHLIWNKAKDFLQMAFTVIFLATVVIWFLQTFDFHFNMVENGEGSMLAWLAGLIAPVFSPMGLGDWKIVTSLISGLLAKESIVSTLQVLGAAASLTVHTAVPMLIFCLLYTPCVAAIASIKRELGVRWAAHVIAFQCVIAWLCAYAGYLVAGLFL